MSAKLREEGTCVNLLKNLLRQLSCLHTIQHVSTTGTVLLMEKGQQPLVVTVTWRLCPGSQGYSSSALLLLWGGCKHGQQLHVLLVKHIRISLVPSGTKTASAVPLLQAGCREPAEQEEALLQRSLFWREPQQSEMFPLSYSLFLPAWHFDVVNLPPFPKSPIHFSVMLYCVSGWSGVDLYSSFKTSSKQQLKYPDVCFLLCVMSHSCKNNSQIQTREIYYLRDEQIIVRNTKIEK